MKADRVLETCLYVDDLDEAADFYSRVLGLDLHSRQKGRHVFMRCGESMLLLFSVDGVRRGSDNVPGHGADGPGHVAFGATDRTIDQWRDKLIGEGIAIERDVDWPGGGRSIYFRDPSGNSLEFVTPATWDLPDDRDPPPHMSES